MSKLYQYFKGNLQRVDKQLPSLHSKCAYLLITEAAVCLFVGANVGRVDKAKAENLADSLKAEVRGASKLHKISQAEPQSYLLTENAYFWRELGVSAVNARSINEAISNNEPTVVPARIWKMTKGGDGVAAMELCAESVTDASGKTRPLAIPELSPECIYLLVADTLEAMVWVGNRVEKEEKDQCDGVLQAHLSSIGATSSELIHIKSHMEPTVFKFHLCAAALDSLVSKTSLNVRRASATEYKQAIAVRKTGRDVEQDIAARHRLASKVASESDNKRPIGAEVERMTNELMGTLAMLTQGVGDNTRALKLSLLEDESSHLTVWAIKGSSRKLEPVPEAEYGVFDASVVYAVLYECKAGAKVILYMWIGEQCPGARKAALTLQANDLIQRQQISGAIEQISVDQEKEPQFFLSMFAKRHHPVLLVQSPLADAPSTCSCRIFETYSFHTTLPHESIVGQELSPNELAARGLMSNRSYVFVKFEGARPVSVTLILGASMGTQFQQQSQELAAHLAEPTGASVSSLSWEERDAALSQLLPDHRIESHEILVTSNGAPLRPRRLWCVSNTRRRVGAMFVEEIGQGGTFAQTDLNANDCFVLDDGVDTLFVWHGPQADLQSRELATKVARLYCKRCKAQKNVQLSIVHLESQSESVQFRAMFLKWNNGLQQVPNKTFVEEFNPDAVEDERDAPTVRSAATKLWEPASAPRGRAVTVTAALLRDAGIGGGGRPLPPRGMASPPQSSPGTRRSIRRSDVDSSTAVMSKPTISTNRRAPTKRRPTTTAFDSAPIPPQSPVRPPHPIPPQSPVRSPPSATKSSPVLRRSPSSSSSISAGGTTSTAAQSTKLRAIATSPLRPTVPARASHRAEQVGQASSSTSSSTSKPVAKAPPAHRRTPSDKLFPDAKGTRPGLRRTLSEVPSAREINSGTAGNKPPSIVRPSQRQTDVVAPLPSTTAQRVPIRRQLMRSQSSGGELAGAVSDILGRTTQKPPNSPIAPRSVASSVRQTPPMK